MQVDIDMGTTSAGDVATLDIEELLATRLLVQGNSGSGKSHLLRRLLEQSAKWVQQVVIDPEGDFVTLSEAFGHIVVDAERSEGELIGIANRIRQHRVSCVLTLEGLEIEDQMRTAATFLNALFDADRDHWYPVLTVVDEAQMFAPSGGGVRTGIGTTSRHSSPHSGISSSTSVTASGPSATVQAPHAHALLPASRSSTAPEAPAASRKSTETSARIPTTPR